jgi:5'-3' exoribonuclease 2
MAVFPPQSAHAIPECFHDLIFDENSEIADFYPSEFHIDVKGKRYAWMGEVLLPFVEEDRLLNAMAKYEAGMREEEIERNKRGFSFIYCHKESDLSRFVCDSMSFAEICNIQARVSLDYKIISLEGMLMGYNAVKLGAQIKRGSEVLILSDIDNNQAISFIFLNPPMRKHDTNLLEGVEMPRSEITDYAFETNDRKFYAGSRTIRMIERTLGIDNDNNEQFNRGLLMQGGHEGDQGGAMGNRSLVPMPYEDRRGGHGGFGGGGQRGGQGNNNYNSFFNR